MSDAPQRAAFEQILQLLQQTRGFEFTAYKRASLTRRMRKRMEAVNVPAFDQYLEYLQRHPDELPALFNTILINVTGFFRDREVWEAIATTVLPSLLSSRADGPLRVWIAGTATGQEAYTAAMLVAEQIGLNALGDRVTICATDVDEEALADARQACYTKTQVAEVPDSLRVKYFERERDRWRVGRELRRGVTFGRHDLLQDPPISRVDLLLCRNTLMYLNGEAQRHVMSRFHRSVVPGGYLVLGPAEMLFRQAALFKPVDLKRRIFRTSQTMPDREPQVSAAAACEDMVNQPSDPGARLRQLAFELQSTNEELETTDEKLQSIDAQLQRMNAELRYTPR